MGLRSECCSPSVSSIGTGARTSASRSRCSCRRCRSRSHTCFHWRSRPSQPFRWRPSNAACLPSGRPSRPSSFPSLNTRSNLDGWRRRLRCLGCRPVLPFECRRRSKSTRRAHKSRWRGYSPRRSGRYRMRHRRNRWSVVAAMPGVVPVVGPAVVVRAAAVPIAVPTAVSPAAATAAHHGSNGHSKPRRKGRLRPLHLRWCSWERRRECHK